MGKVEQCSDEMKNILTYEKRCNEMRRAEMG